MRIRLLLVAGLAVGSSLIATAPASASCQTNPDIGDWCKVRDAVYNSVCSTKPGGYLEQCQD